MRCYQYFFTRQLSPQTSIIASSHIHGYGNQLKFSEISGRIFDNYLLTESTVTDFTQETVTIPLLTVLSYGKKVGALAVNVYDL